MAAFPTFAADSWHAQRPDGITDVPLLSEDNQLVNSHNKQIFIQHTEYGEFASVL